MEDQRNLINCNNDIIQYSQVYYMLKRKICKYQSLVLFLHIALPVYIVTEVFFVKIVPIISLTFYGIFLILVVKNHRQNKVLSHMKTPLNGRALGKLTIDVLMRHSIYIFCANVCGQYQEVDQSKGIYNSYVEEIKKKGLLGDGKEQLYEIISIDHVNNLVLGINDAIINITMLKGNHQVIIIPIMEITRIVLKEKNVDKRSQYLGIIIYRKECKNVIYPDNVDLWLKVLRVSV